MRAAVILAVATLLPISRGSAGFLIHSAFDRPLRPIGVLLQVNGNGVRGSHELAHPPTTGTTQTSNRKSQVLAGKNQLEGDRKAYRDEVLGASERRGKILFAASMLLVGWSFSIPIELRRAHWCFIDSCVQDRSSCFDCLTFGEWVQKVLAFYASTPAKDWVHFDFSVDPNFIWSVEKLTGS
mmetsp:Transcript_19092/g.38461  ORF Transcript_19092/g.38461 Transcript_19092/m.38461 type:complete len:182 (-) Transcript_19092:54-599(-)